MVSSVYIKPLLAILVMAAVIGITVVVFRNDRHGPTTDRSTNQQLPRNIDVSLKKARFSEIQNGLVAWELVAERADYDKEGNTAFLSNIRMEFRNTGSQGAVTASADRGEYSSTAKTVTLDGNVHISTEEGADFQTSSIVYNADMTQFSTTAPVTFRQQRLHLQAVGMDLGVRNQKARFYSSIDASVVLN